MTTVASGRCTTARRCGKRHRQNPRDATSAVMRTGRKRNSAAFWMAAMWSRLPPRDASRTNDQHENVQHRDTEERDELRRQRRWRMESSAPQARPSSDDRERHVHEDQRRRTRGSERRAQEEEDQRERERYDDREAPACVDVVLELTAPFDAVAGRQLHIAMRRLSGRPRPPTAGRGHARSARR